MPFKTDRRSLYEQDFALWLDETAAQLKARNLIDSLFSNCGELFHR